MTISSFKMQSIFCGLFLLIVLCAENGHAASGQCKASNVGTNFIFGIIGYIELLNSTNINLHITTTDQVHAKVRVIAPYIHFDRSYTISNYTVIPLNGTLFQNEPGTQLKGIEVISDVPVSVTVLTDNGDHFILEGYLAVPVHALGTRYIAASYIPRGEVLVAGVENNTDVTLITRLNGHTDSNRTIRLQKFETYQFKSDENVYDVSGSIVTSNKPVAVFSGSQFAQVPKGIGCYHYLAEQMIPTNYWTTKFIVPPIYPRKHSILRSFSDHDNTLLRYYNSTKQFNVTITKNAMVEHVFGTDPVVIIADKPISVVQYGHDGDNMNGDPFMSIVQGITQFYDSYKFFTQNYFSGGSNSIAITIQKQNISGLVLNEHPMSYWNATFVSVTYPMTEFVTLFVNVTVNTYFHLYHKDRTKFGAIIYGLPGSCSAYGYPLLLSLTDNACENQMPSSTTTPIHSTATVTIQKSTPVTQDGQGKWCFNCDGMAHLKYCDKVARCQTKNEVCYVQKYTRSIDVDLYRSGCIQPEKCDSRVGNGGCLECCTGYLCNKVGCGDNGFSDIGQRGPICFDCTHKGENEDCKTVQLCHSNQVCMVERYEWGDNDFHYISGCADSMVCTSKRSITARHAPVCTHCCHSDFCNINCTSGNTGPAIIG